MLAFPANMSRAELRCSESNSLGQDISGLQAGPSGKPHKISSSNDSPSATIRRDSYTVSYTMVMACTRPQPMSETSAVLGEQRRTLRATDLIFSKWQRELLS
jgi:hypothetical protein